MAKLYFKYGAMGSSKTAQALITKFNYEERGMKVWIGKPSIDTRDGENIIQSRIGLKAEANIIHEADNLYTLFYNMKEKYDVIIIDEAQFLHPEQVNQLGDIVMQLKIPVMCFGLKTDFQTKMFPGSKRLFEIAESINEIKTICKCGRKATVNARIDAEGKVITEGAQVELGGNDRYIAMCYKCYSNIVRRKYCSDMIDTE